MEAHHHGTDYTMHDNNAGGAGSVEEEYAYMTNGNNANILDKKKLKAQPLPEIDFNKKEEIKKKMSPLSLEQLTDILAKAGVVHPDVRATIDQLVEASPASRRLMIRNISFNTTEAALKEILLRYGNLDDFTICKDRVTGTSKGFGFATFSTMDAVERILADPLVVDGRTLMLKLASDPITEPIGSGAGGASGGSHGDVSRCKLFIRNLSDTTTDALLKEEFAPYGEISEAVVVKNNDGESRGYGFVTYMRPEDAQKALQIPQRVIAGRMAFISLAATQGGGPGKFRGGGAGMGGGGMPSAFPAGYAADRSRYHGNHGGPIGGVPYTNPHSPYGAHGRPAGTSSVAAGMYPPHMSHQRPGMQAPVTHVQQMPASSYAAPPGITYVGNTTGGLPGGDMISTAPPAAAGTLYTQTYTPHGGDPATAPGTVMYTTAAPGSRTVASTPSTYTTLKNTHVEGPYMPQY